MFYIIIVEDSGKVKGVHICKLDSLQRACMLAGVDVQEAKYCIITKEEINALLTVSRGIVTKLV